MGDETVTLSALTTDAQEPRFRVEFMGHITHVQDKGLGAVFTVEVAQARYLRGFLRDMMLQDLTIRLDLNDEPEGGADA